MVAIEVTILIHVPIDLLLRAYVYKATDFVIVRIDGIVKHQVLQTGVSTSFFSDRVSASRLIDLKMRDAAP
jgi:hypothetical protein